MSRASEEWRNEISSSLFRNHYFSTVVGLGSSIHGPGIRITHQGTDSAGSGPTLHPGGTHVRAICQRDIIHGRLGQAPHPPPWHGGKGEELSRTLTPNFSGHGLLVAVVDTPSDRKEDGLYDFRTSVEHAQDIQGVIDRLREKNNVPIFLVGTSQGTISAAGVTARLKSRGIAGVVLTSTVTRTNNRGDKEQVFDADLELIRTPVLVVYHEDDGCYVTPYEDADRLMDSLVNARHKKLLSYKGGKYPESDACRALSEHGFFGIEERVVGDIVSWIKEQAKVSK